MAGARMRACHFPEWSAASAKSRIQGVSHDFRQSDGNCIPNLPHCFAPCSVDDVIIGESLNQFSFPDAHISHRAIGKGNHIFPARNTMCARFDRFCRLIYGRSCVTRIGTCPLAEDVVPQFAWRPSYWSRHGLNCFTKSFPITFLVRLGGPFPCIWAVRPESDNDYAFSNLGDAVIGRIYKAVTHSVFRSAITVKIKA